MSWCQLFICNYAKTTITSKSNYPEINFSSKTEEHNFYKSLVSVHRNIAFESKELFVIFNNPKLLPDDIRDLHIKNDNSDGYFLVKDNITQFKSVVEYINNNTTEKTGFKELIEKY